MSSNGTAVMLLYGGPPTLIALMFGYGVTLLQKKANQEPSTPQKMSGWFLILLSISIVCFFIASKIKK